MMARVNLRKQMRVRNLPERVLTNAAQTSIGHDCCTATCSDDAMSNMFSHSVTRRQWGRVGVMAAASACLPAPATLRAQRRSDAAMPVRMAVGGQAGLCYLPLTVALGLGFFREEGLDIRVVDYAGGAFALQALQEGTADVCCGAFDHVVRQQLRGMPYRSLVLLGRAPQLTLATSLRHGPKALSGFKGMRVGVTAPGSSTQFLASLWLNQAGVSSEDVSFVGVGVGSAAVAALRQGRVHALCLPDPVITLLEHRGEVRLLVDTRTLKSSAEIFDGTMPAACLYAPQVYVQRHSSEVQALVNAMVRALTWLQTASAADLARVVPAPYLLGNRGAYLAAFQNARETFSPDGLMPDDGPATAARVLAQLQADVVPARLALDKTFSNDWARQSRQQFKL